MEHETVKTREDGVSALASLPVEIRIARLRMNLTVTRMVSIDPFPGRALHGLLSSSIAEYARELSCPWGSDAEQLTAALDRLKFDKKQRPFSIAVSEWGKEQTITKGMTYSFELTLFGAAVEWWRAICEAVNRRGLDDAPKDEREARRKFAGNFRLSVEDAHDSRLLDWTDPDAEPTILCEEAIQLRIEALRNASSWQMELTTPLEIQPSGRDSLNPDELQPQLLFNALKSRYLVFAPTAAQPSPRAYIRWPIERKLINADARHAYSGTDTTAERLWLRGVIGVIILSEAWRPMLPALALAEIIGMGVGTPFGKGRFKLSPVDSTPQKISLADIAQLSRLWEARDESEKDDLTDGELADEELEQITRELEAGTYNPEPLRSVSLPKAGGGSRTLSIPAPHDMLVQRAMLHTLRPIIDARLEAVSSAFRPSNSRFQTAAAIEAARQDGFEYVFRADIERFFDAIQFDKLESMLRNLPLDQPVIDLLMRMIRCPVRQGGSVVAREQGLPQGTPLSPLLANLYLDQFDEAIMSRGYRLVRFADDFLIAARTEEEAAEAGRVAAEELEKLELVLSKDKTGIVTFDQGFAFLGFLFARSLVLERKGQVSAATVYPAPEDHTSEFFVSTDVSHDPLLRSIHVEGYGYRLGCEGHRFVVRKEGHEVARVPAQWIDEITISGSASLTPAMIRFSLQHNVAVWFVNRSGKLLGKLGGVDSDPSELWLRQQALFQESEIRRKAACSLIWAKIANQAAVLRRHVSTPGMREAVERLRDLSREAQSIGSLSALLGIEGRAAAVYFGEWPALLSKEMQFKGRRRRPPTDPVNVLLSIGYTRLRTQLRGLVERHGLSPFFGVLHEGRLQEVGEKRHDVLVSDLMEPFRPQIDRLVLAMFRRSDIKTSDFTYSEKDNFRYRISSEARGKFFDNWERACRSPVQYQGHTITLLRAMDRVVYDFKKWIASEGKGRTHMFRMR